MPMGIVSDNDLEKELNNLNKSTTKPKITAEIINNPDKGRQKGSVEVPNSLRNVIAGESIENGRGSALELAKNFDISPSSVSAYTNGSTSTSTYDTKPNGNKVQKVKDKISLKARKRLMSALNFITDDKLANAKLRDVSSVAKDMSAIVKNMESSGPIDLGANGPTFIFYSPKIVSEDRFKVINVKE